MSDITVDPTLVTPSPRATKLTVVLGETVAAGQPVYKKLSDSKWYKSANTQPASAVGGICVVSGAANASVSIVTKDDYLVIGPGLLTAGLSYGISGSTAGSICPQSDNVAGTNRYMVHLGLAVSDSALRVDFTTVWPGVYYPN